MDGEDSKPMSIAFNSAPYWLDPNNPDEAFPNPELATIEPYGLLALGGDLSPQRLLNAYRCGIFPWFDTEQAILWWSPNPRAVLYPAELKISRSLSKTVRNKGFEVRFDTAFAEVVNACSQARQSSEGTWIDSRIKSAYLELHKLKHAHSAEAWLNGELVGGLYGVAIGQVFYGESMFYHQRDASKVAFVSLVRTLQHWGFQMIDCQMTTEHLLSLGAKEIPRREFNKKLDQWCTQAASEYAWKTL